MILSVPIQDKWRCRVNEMKSVHNFNWNIFFSVEGFFLLVVYKIFKDMQIKGRIQSCRFLRIFTVALLLFLAPAGHPKITHHPYYMWNWEETRNFGFFPWPGHTFNLVHLNPNFRHIYIYNLDILYEYIFYFHIQECIEKFVTVW